jgi:hypothetical protein
MNAIRSSIPVVAALFATALGAQSPLVVDPAGHYTVWNPAAAVPQTFFDMEVHTPLTLRKIDMPFMSPIGTVGTLELYKTGGSFVGKETTPAAWTLMATGRVVVSGPASGVGGTTVSVCVSFNGGG